MGLITKSECMSVTDHAVRYLGHVDDVCSKLQKIFWLLLFNVSDHLVASD